jgi:hypothetical protein
MGDEGMRDQADTHPAPHEYSPRTKVVVANPKSPSVLGLAGFMARSSGCSPFLFSVSISTLNCAWPAMELAVALERDLVFFLCPSHVKGRRVRSNIECIHNFITSLCDQLPVGMLIYGCHARLPTPESQLGWPRRAHDRRKKW